MALEDRIKEARKHAGLTQEQAARCIGVAKSTWAGYEIGNSQPDIAKLVKIMEVLNVDANYLWQDYRNEKNSPAPVGAEERMSLEDSTAMLVELGYIRPGEQLSDADLAFFEHIVGLMDAWFDSKKP